MSFGAYVFIFHTIVGFRYTHSNSLLERDNFGDKLMKLMCDDQDNRMKMFGY